ncbi:MAG: Nitrogen fixation protein RnfG [Bacteroidota bacterium]|jgi:electron transport complex protein RnfG
MAKRESTLFNMILALTVIGFVSAAVLGYVYQLTAGPIEKAKQAKLNNAIQQVAPAFDNQPGTESYELPQDGDEALACYPCRKGKVLVGTAVRTYSDKGFSKRIYIMIGLDPTGKIINTSVLEHGETPGLGDKMDKSKSPWSDQFNDKDPASFKLKVTKDGGSVDAITAATISSRAFTDAVDRAYTSYMKGGKHE